MPYSRASQKPVQSWTLLLEGLLKRMALLASAANRSWLWARRIQRKVELPFVLIVFSLGFLYIHGLLPLPKPPVAHTAHSGTSIVAASHPGSVPGIPGMVLVRTGLAQVAKGTHQQSSLTSTVVATTYLSPVGSRNFASSLRPESVTNRVLRATSLFAPPPINWGPDIPLPSCGGIGPIVVPICQFAVQSVLAVYGFITMVIAVNVGQSLILPFVDPADPNTNFLLGTPPTLSYANSGIIVLYSVVALPLALLFIAVIVGWSGLNMMVRPHLGMSYQGVMEFLPRMLLGVGMAVFGIGNSVVVTNAITGWISGLIQMVNAIDTAIPNPVILVPGNEWPNLADHPTAAGIVFAAFAAGETILLLILLWQLIVRVAVIDVLIVAAPLAMVCWILPQTQRWTELWTRTFVGMLLVQPIQLLALNVGAYIALTLIFINPTNPTPQSLILQAILQVAILSVVLRLPRLMQSTQAFSGSIMTLTGLYFGMRTVMGVGSLGMDAAKGAADLTGKVFGP